MGRILTITSSRDAATGVKKRAFNKELSIGTNAIKFISLAIFAILAIIYLTQSTAGANRSIDVTDLNNKTKDLEVRKERLEVEKSRLESLGEIDATIENKPLTPVTSVDHIDEANRVAILN